MLRGTITHKATGFSYKVYGMDTAGSLNLRINSQKFNAICLMSNPDCVELGNELWERGIKISTAKIDVETEHHTDATTGKIVKSPPIRSFSVS